MIKKTILEIIGIAVTIYIFGLFFVLAVVADGYEGGDILTEHYRSVVQFIVGLF